MVLPELKKQIEKTEEDILAQSTKVFDLKETLRQEEKILEVGQKQLERLRFALGILEEQIPLNQKVSVTPGPQDPPPPSEVEPVKPVAPAPIPRGPICSACGKGVMRQMYRRVPSGVTVSMMQCDDSACNNEVY